MIRSRGAIPVIPVAAAIAGAAPLGLAGRTARSTLAAFEIAVARGVEAAATAPRPAEAAAAAFGIAPAAIAARAPFPAAAAAVAARLAASPIAAVFAARKIA